jgi:hypothetical protein
MSTIIEIQGTIKMDKESVELADSLPRSTAPFAVTVDGTFLINVDVLDALKPAALEGRRLFVGAEIEGSERELAASMLNEAGHDLRARIAARMSGARAFEPAPEPATAIESEVRTDSEDRPG